MKSLTTRFLPVIVAFICGFAAALALNSTPQSFAQTKSGVALGGGHAGVEIENHKYQTLKGNRSTVRTQRDVISVSDSYGRLINVTTARNKTVLWYQANDGSVRNVIVQDALVPIRVKQP